MENGLFLVEDVKTKPIQFEELIEECKRRKGGLYIVSNSESRPLNLKSGEIQFVSQLDGIQITGRFHK